MARRTPPKPVPTAPLLSAEAPLSAEALLPAQDHLAMAWAFFHQGRHALAAEALIPLLGNGADTAPALAAALLRAELRRPTPDPEGLPVAGEALSDAVERLLVLVRRQDEQIAALIGAAA